MKAIVLDRHGGPEVLRVRTVPDPVPGAGEVRVRVEAIGVNYAEVLSRKGLYGWAPAMPYTPGMEATGTIDALGAEAAVNYRRPDFEERLRVAAGPERFDVVLEVVGGEVCRAVWPVLAPFGRVVVAGFASLALQRWNPLSWLRTWRDLPKADIRSLAPASHGLMATHLGYLINGFRRTRRRGIEPGERPRPICEPADKVVTSIVNRTNSL
jgi:NADPH:quinone reductase-like Zn-dependent oxidoreductase